MISMQGLYIHIPFCLRKCHYCEFVITTDRSLQAQTRFLEAFERELLEAANRYGPMTRRDAAEVTHWERWGEHEP